MPKKKSTIRGLKVGDLVFHLLYGREWVGVLLEIVDVYTDPDGKHNEMGLVKMQPGSKFQEFFKDMVSKNNRLTDSLGLVSTDWLFPLKEKNRKEN
tara:strand:- start:825 stop:1112 length:288 start_codon:yes stop_codon:yes gene_type:complete